MSHLHARRRRVLFSAGAAAIVAAATIACGIYAQKVMNPSELVHFFIPFPAGRIVRPMTVKKPNGEGVFTRPLTIDVDKRGILKRLLNPNIEGIGTHWLVNVDTKPHRIGIKLTNVSVPVEWKVGSGIPFDEATGTFSSPIESGQQIPDLGIDWLFHFTPESWTKAVLYEGQLIVFDADTQETLTVIPVKFQQAKPKAPADTVAAAADCCAP